MKQTEIVKLVIMEEQLKNVIKTLEQLKPKINNMHETFIKGDGKIQSNRVSIQQLNKTLNGNGNIGVVDKIQLIEKRMAYYAGGLVVAVAIVQIIIGVLT